MASYPHLVFRPSVYLVTDVQKAELVKRLVRAQRIWLGFVALVTVALVLTPRPRWPVNFDYHSGGPAIWLLPFGIGAVLGILIVLPNFILVRQAMEPVLSTARRIGPATRWQVFQRDMEASSIKMLIGVLALLCLSLALNVHVLLTMPGVETPALVFIAVTALAGTALVVTLLKKLKERRALR